MEIAITDNMGTGHVMMCRVVSQTNDTIIIENGRKTYTMRFCKRTGKCLDVRPGLLDCLVLADSLPLTTRSQNDY